MAETKRSKSLETLKSKIDEVITKLTAFIKSIEDNTNSLNNSEDEVKNLNKNFANMARSIDGLTKSINENATAVNGCKDKIDENSKNITELSNEIKKLSKPQKCSKGFCICPCIALLVIIAMAVLISIAYVFFNKDFSETVTTTKYSCVAEKYCSSDILACSEQNENSVYFQTPAKPAKTETQRNSKWALCVILSVCVISLAVVSIFYGRLCLELQVKDRKLSLLENLKDDILKNNLNLDCKYELSKRITSAITEI